MSNIYTQDLLSGSGSGSVDVPVGELWVIRDISGVISSPILSETSACFFSGAGSEFYVALALSGELRNFHWEGRVAVRESEAVACLFSGSGSVSFVVTGYTLTGP